VSTAVENERKVHEIDDVATASPFRSRKGYDVTRLRKIA